MYVIRDKIKYRAKVRTKSQSGNTGFTDGLRLKDDLSKADIFFSTRMSDLIGLLNNLCFRCSSVSAALSEKIEKPSFESLKKGLELETIFYLSSTFPEIIKQFNKDKELALDEYDENSTERITEEIRYLQERKKEIQNKCNIVFFEVWKECMDSITNTINYEAIINKLRPDADEFVEDIMKESRLKSNLKEVYLYDYITSEIKRLKKKQSQIQEPQKVSVQELSGDIVSNEYIYGNLSESLSTNHEPKQLVLKSFKHDNLFVREIVKEIINVFYSNSATNLALIETVFYDHDLLRKRNKHKDFLNDLIKMDAISINDEVISKTANGMSVKMKKLPKTGYRSWPNINHNDKKMCIDISEKLDPTMKYKGLL